MREEVLGDRDVLEAEDGREGAEDALDGRAFNFRDEVGGPDADPFTVGVRRGVDRVDGGDG
jgi:hypothetical protein